MISRRTLLGSGVCVLSSTALYLGAFEAVAADAHERTYDVVVVGGGGAGLAAATSAAQMGAKVCLIEKLAVLGGDTLRSTGYFSCVEDKRQKASGIADSMQNHFEQTLSSGGNLADPLLVKRMVQDAPSTVQWLESCGVVFHDSVYEIYGSLYKRCLKPILPRGTAYIRALSQQAAELGVEILTQTALTDLISDSNGRIVGIRAKSGDGAHLTLRAARGVVLASGGYGANSEMVTRYAPSLQGLPSDNSPGSTGDAIAIAQKYGIALTGLSFVECVAGNPPGRKTHARLFLPADFILINEKGERFVEEDARRIDLTEAILAQPNRRCFTVFDTSGVSHLDPISQKGLYRALVADEALSADSLEELAELMQIPVKPFLACVADYNNRAADRHFKEETPSKCSRIGCTPLVKPPFWAYEVGLTVHYTPGGIVTDCLARCLRKDGSIVPGLWAAGEVTGSVHGANRLGGNGLTDAFTNGRIAGSQAAKMR